MRSFSPFRSASVLTGLRECRNTSAVRMKSGIDTMPNFSSRNWRSSSAPPASYSQCSMYSELKLPA